MKLLCLCVSEHREENLVRPIWNGIFEDGKIPLISGLFGILIASCSALEGPADPQATADRIIAKVVPLGKRFYPSESAFPLRKSIGYEKALC
jgi:nuclear pore complex protein Nup155